MALGHPQPDQLAAALVPDEVLLDEELPGDVEEESDDDAAGAEDVDVEDEPFEPEPFAARLSVR